MGVVSTLIAVALTATAARATDQSQQDLRLLLAAIAQGPRNARAHYLLGNHFRDADGTNHHEEIAYRAAAACASRARDRAAALNGLAGAIHRRRHGAAAEALPYYAAAIDAYPAFSTAYQNRGVALLDVDTAGGADRRAVEALHAFRRATAIAPAEAGPWRGAGLARRRIDKARRANEDAGDVGPDAAACFARAAALAPADRGAWAAWATGLAADDGRPDEAVAAVRAKLRAQHRQQQQLGFRAELARLRGLRPRVTFSALVALFAAIADDARSCTDPSGADATNAAEVAAARWRDVARDVLVLAYGFAVPEPAGLLAIAAAAARAARRVGGGARARIIEVGAGLGTWAAVGQLGLGLDWVPTDAFATHLTRARNAATEVHRVTPVAAAVRFAAGHGRRIPADALVLLLIWPPDEETPEHFNMARDALFAFEALGGAPPPDKTLIYVGMKNPVEDNFAGVASLAERGWSRAARPLPLPLTTRLWDRSLLGGYNRASRGMTNALHVFEFDGGNDDA